MVYDSKEIQFLNLTENEENGFLKTKIFSKPTNNHEYLDVRSSHQQAVFRSIPRTLANRVRRNCTDDSEFVRARSEYSNYHYILVYYILVYRILVVLLMHFKTSSLYFKKL